MRGGGLGGGNGRHQLEQLLYLNHFDYLLRTILHPQVYAWGDNEYGQQGNGSTICNRKPQHIVSLKDHRITKIACGSSHSIAFATSSPASSGEFTPISFQTTQDSLGTALTSSKPPPEIVKESDDNKRPSLTKIVLSLLSPAKQQEALAHIQTALQIAYARDAIVSSLGGVALAVQESEETESEQGTSVEITGVIPPSPEVTTGGWRGQWSQLVESGSVIFKCSH